jgi:phosphohistidine phosphatase SixA
MRLYLMRHGHANNPLIDSQQHLSPTGIAEAVQIAEFLREKQAAVTAIWHSPLPRACQTAEIISPYISFKTIQSRNGLLPEDSPRHILPDINSFPDDLLIITHMPFVSHLAGLLTAAATQRSFPTAGLAAFEKKDSHFVLDFFVYPQCL